MRLIGSGLARYGSRIRVGIVLTSLVVAGAFALRLDTKAPRQATNHDIATSFASDSAAVKQARAHFGQLPMVFEPNQGQTSSRVKYLVHGSNYALFLTANEAVLALHKSPKEGSVLRMALAHANANARIEGADLLPGKSNYLIGNDPTKWHQNIPQFAKVRYQDIYPGVDLVYYGNQGRLEYDVEVAPNADPHQVAMQFPGASKLTLNSQGEVVIPTGEGDVRLQAPKIYQKVGDEQRPVKGRFVLRSANEVGFEIAGYDHSRTLVIDPVLVYSTYLGGTLAEACSAITQTGIPQSRCPAIAVDAAASAYIAGSTTSTNFPVVSGSTAFQSTLNGAANLYVTKLDSTGSAILYSTYIGGGGVDLPGGIAIDAMFNVDITGTTTSGNFPTFLGFQNTPVSAGSHAFVTQLRNDGTALNYSTYLSGDGTDTATGIAIDYRSHVVYVTGTTSSTNFPVFPNPGAFQTAPKATNQFFLTSIDTMLAGNLSLLYSTYLGGSSPSTGVAQGGGIAVDINSNTPGVYITGGTDFSDMPAINSFQPYKAGKDVFLAKFTFFPKQINSTPTLTYLTYLGGSGDDVGMGVAVDNSFIAYVTGATTSTDFGQSTTTGTPSFQAANGGGTDAFVAKVQPCTVNCSASSTVQLLYFTYLGGSGTDVGTDIAVDGVQGARVTGYTNSPNLPILNPLPTFGSVLNGGMDAFVARIDTTATLANAPSYTVSYLGGSGNDGGTGIAVDPTSNVYVAGETSSGNFPTVTPLQGALSGLSDSFISKIGPKVSFTMTASGPGAQTGVGNQVSFVYTITNTGDAVSGVTFTDFVPVSGATFAGTSSNSCGGVSSGAVTCNLGTLNSGSVTTISVNLIPTVPGALANSAQLTTAASSGIVASASASAQVNDFAVSISPASQTVPAGLPAVYAVTVSTIPQNSQINTSISVAVGSGLPPGTQERPVFSTNPIPSLSTGSATTTLTIPTMMRTTTITGKLQRLGPIYASWLPISGLALLGLGIGGKISRRRKWLAGLCVAAVLVMIGLQAGCSSSRQSSLTNGTPAGTYTLTVTATSGTISHATSFTLVVQ